MIGSGWALCPVCGLMVGWNREHTENKNPVGQRCGDYLKFAGNCNGILRSLTWDDMKPITKE